MRAVRARGIIRAPCLLLSTRAETWLASRSTATMFIMDFCAQPPANCRVSMCQAPDQASTRGPRQTRSTTRAKSPGTIPTAVASRTGLCARPDRCDETVPRGIDRFGRRPQGREALMRHVKSVMLTIAGQPTVTLNAGTLMVTFDPDHGYECLASSLAISRAFALARRSLGA